MRDKDQNDSLGQEAQASNSPESSVTLAAVWGYWRAYWKLAPLGILLVALALVLVVQNSQAIQLKFLVWEADMSLALVVLLALLSGFISGAAFNGWQRRSPRRSEP